MPDDTELDRRRYVRLLGSAVTGIALSGCQRLLEEDTPTETAPGPSVTPSPGARSPPTSTDETAADTTSPATPTRTTEQSVERRGIEFNRVLDAVDDLGMDPNGDTPIDDALKLGIGVRTLIEFPPGRYRFSSRTTIQRVRNFGIRGTGAHRDEVTFFTGRDDGTFFVRTEGGRNFLVENVTFDSGPGRRGSVGIAPILEDGLEVHDVEFTGFNPTVNNGGIDDLRPSITDPDGTGTVDTLVRTGPTDITTHSSVGNDENSGSIYVGRRHRGTLDVRNVHIENTGTNAVYASKTPGDVHIEDGLFRNNNQTVLRIGGQGSYVRNSTFVVDTENAHPENQGSYINPHGIIWETGEFGKTGGFVEGCEFDWRAAPERALPVIWVDGSAGGMTIRDTTISTDVDGFRPVIRFDSPTDPRLGKTAARPWGVTLDSVTISGAATIDGAAVMLVNRPRSIIRDSCIQMTGECDGIALVDSNRCSIQGTSISVSGEVLSLENTVLAKRDIKNGGCRS